MSGVATSHRRRRCASGTGTSRTGTAEFAERYRQELTEPSRAAACDHLLELARSGPVTLVTATRAIEISHAAVLSDVLTARF